MKKAAVGMMVCGLMVCGLADRAGADAISVGSGTNTATVYVGFKDGAMYEFDVSFDAPAGETFTGLDLIDLVGDETPLSIAYGYGGGYVDGMSYEDHGNSGYGGGDDWWHYWVAEEGDTGWTAPGYGAGDRVVSDGSMDGWIYGSAHTPPAIPEPATMALLAVGGLAVLARRKNRS
jgi:hypothetical protein